MKIVLRADVEHLGRKGDLLEVTDGYARNYLVPRGMAIKATKGAVAQAEAMRRNRAARDARDREGADAAAAQLGARPLRVLARAGRAASSSAPSPTRISPRPRTNSSGSTSTGAPSSSPSRSGTSARPTSRCASTPR